MIKTKQVYEKPQKSDGIRILVDRYWPRGLSKKAAKIDMWLDEIAPSTELIAWFAHDPQKWPQFLNKYYDELKNKPELIEELKKLKNKTLTFVYAAKDEMYNNAAALCDYIQKKREADSKK